MRHDKYLQQICEFERRLISCKWSSGYRWGWWLNLSIQCVCVCVCVREREFVWWWWADNCFVSWRVGWKCLRKGKTQISCPIVSVCVLVCVSKGLFLILESCLSRAFKHHRSSWQEVPVIPCFFFLCHLLISHSNFTEVK